MFLVPTRNVVSRSVDVFFIQLNVKISYVPYSECLKGLFAEDEVPMLIAFVDISRLTVSLCDGLIAMTL